MIKCISYLALKDGLSNTHSIDDALAQARQTGFKGFELCIGPAGALNTQSTRQECDAISKLVAASGLTVQTICTGISWGVNPTSEDPAVRKKSIALHAAALERAGWLGLQALLMVPGVVRSPISPDVVRYDKAIERCREAVKQLLDTAEKAKVDLCLENVWNGMFYSPLELRDFIDSFKNERLGVYFDVGNCMGYHQYPPHWIEILGKRIKRIHVKDFIDNFGWTGGYAFCALGAGQVPWKETMAALRGIGYDKTFVGELLPWDPANLARTSAAMDVILAL